MGDYGAARIAARKAREAAPSDPRPWVVSAWIELAEDNNKQAKAYADEALIADEDKSAAVDVQEVRGVAFEVLDNHDRAISCYRQALKYAPDTYKGQLYLRLARVLSSDESFDACLEAYSLANNLGSDTREQINQIVRHEVTNSSSGRLKNLEGKVNARDFLAADRGMLLGIIASCMRACELKARGEELNRLADRLRDQPRPYRDEDSFINLISDCSVLSMPFAIIGLFIIFQVGGSLPSVLRTLLWTFFVINTLLLAWCIYSNLEYHSRKKAYEHDQERSRITREKASAVKEEAWKIIRSIRG
ncbi:M48 family metallopeptidase [uncultured Actinomyces sp.]|uniref:tetratricopeptide repeat protein n=1 Tax=uncultured Actinomyces sp. TaxID=249061 RepID=UPI00262E3C33|nr:tetratricopeptide repeat protein [uncultured Actinomyces sp.]